MTVIQIILKIRLYSMENSLKTHNSVKVSFHIIIFNMEFFFIILILILDKKNVFW